MIQTAQGTGGDGDMLSQVGSAYIPIARDSAPAAGHSSGVRRRHRETKGNLPGPPMY